MLLLHPWGGQGMGVYGAGAHPVPHPTVCTATKARSPQYLFLPG